MMPYYTVTFSIDGQITVSADDADAARNAVSEQLSFAAIGEGARDVSVSIDTVDEEPE